MGNLLGSPVTDKETHVGQTSEFEFGLSSMQGWRVHMEDAHIAEANLYAVVEDESLLHNKKGGGKNTNSNKRKGKGPPPNDSAPSRKKKKKTRIPLPGHSFFGVFDGHGGTFAAQYTGDNLCRILAKQPLFVEYAQFYQESMTKTFATNAKKIQFLRSGVDYLEGALKQAFVELDCEIAMAVRGTPHPDANQPYRKYNKKIIKDGIEVEGDDEFEDDDDDMKRYASSTTDDDSSMPSADSPTDMMEAARQAAASQAKALDDDGDSGTTACCVLVTPDWLVCANAGDSRAVFSKSARAVPLSYDHKPDDEGEERRIRTAGGYVAGGRVEGDLAVSRGLGDFRFKHMPTVLSNHNLATNKPNPPPAVELSDGQELMKPGDQKVSPVPDIILQTRNREQDEFVIVACDGIWDVRSNQECVGEVSTIFQEGEADIGLVCEEVST